MKTASLGTPKGDNLRRHLEFIADDTLFELEKVARRSFDGRSTETNWHRDWGKDFGNSFRLGPSG